jgi:hypothetical protein
MPVGSIYIDLDEMLAKREASYVGASVASAEEWHLRKKYEGIARDVFGDGVRIKNGQIIRFRDTAARILTEAGWNPGGKASAMLAARILREHAEELALLVEVKDRPDAIHIKGTPHQSEGLAGVATAKE